MCAEPAAGIADSTMRAIERAAQPAEQQRAGLEALRLRSAAMAQLIASSCPTHPLRGYMGRFAAVTDRLDVMLFAVMTMAPVLQQFYDSLRRQISTGRFPPVTLPSGHRDKHEAADPQPLGTADRKGKPISFLVRVGSVIRSLPGLRMASPGPLPGSGGSGRSHCA